MSRRMRWKLPAVATLAGVAFAASLASVAALVFGSGPLMSFSSLGYAQAHDRKAFALLSTKDPTKRLEAEAEIRRTLSLSPYDNAARLRLAYAYALSGPPLDGEAIHQLAVSYDLVQYDYTAAAWRVAFGLNNWSRVTPDLRRQIHDEAMAFGQAHSRDVDVSRVLKSIHDPEGRLAAALWLHALKE